MAKIIKLLIEYECKMLYYWLYKILYYWLIEKSKKDLSFH